MFAPHFEEASWLKLMPQCWPSQRVADAAFVLALKLFVSAMLIDSDATAHVGVDFVPTSPFVKGLRDAADLVCN